MFCTIRGYRRREVTARLGGRCIFFLQNCECCVFDAAAAAEVKTRAAAANRIFHYLSNQHFSQKQGLI